MYAGGRRALRRSTSLITCPPRPALRLQAAVAAAGRRGCARSMVWRRAPWRQLLWLPGRRRPCRQTSPERCRGGGGCRTSTLCDPQPACLLFCSGRCFALNVPRNQGAPPCPSGCNMLVNEQQLQMHGWQQAGSAHPRTGRQRWYTSKLCRASAAAPGSCHFNFHTFSVPFFRCSLASLAACHRAGTQVAAGPRHLWDAQAKYETLELA